MPPLKTIKIQIDSKPYETADDDQQAASLLRLGGRDPKIYDLFLISKIGVEEKIRDTLIINLKGGERFVSRQKVYFTIDGEDHETYDDDQEAAALLRLAGVDPSGYDLALVIPTGGSQTFRDSDVVKIKNGDEFVTAKHVGGVA
jgi:hypothetical protein